MLRDGGLRKRGGVGSSMVLRVEMEAAHGGWRRDEGEGGRGCGEHKDRGSDGCKVRGAQAEEGRIGTMRFG